MSQTFHGSCLCGALHYRLSSPRAHSLTATAASVARPMARHSPAMAASPSRTCTSTAAPTCSPRSAPSPAVLRRFCSRCGSPLFWSRSEGEFADWVSVALGSLDTPLPGGETEACPGRIDGLLVQDRRRLAAFRLKSARDPPAGACFSPARPGPGVPCRALRRRSLPPMSATALYTDLSHYYDLMCADIDYQAQSHCVRRLHQLFGNQGRRHLDLACGTGPHVRHFLDFGYRSAGLDINQPMLDLARQRCPEAHFSRQDMAGFQVDEPLDLITCFLYSIHYNAGLERLRACLASVHGALAGWRRVLFQHGGQGADRQSRVRPPFRGASRQPLHLRFRLVLQRRGRAPGAAPRYRETTDGTTQTWEDEHPMWSPSASPSCSTCCRRISRCRSSNTTTNGSRPGPAAPGMPRSSA